MKLLIVQCIIVLSSISALVRSNPVRIPSPEEGNNWEGDMIPNPNVLLKGAFQKPDYLATLWPKGEVPFFYDTKSAYSSREKKTIEAGLDHIMNVTTLDGKQVVKFIKLENSDDVGSGKTYRNAIRIVRDNGCYSYVGMIRSMPIQNVSIGYGCVYVGTVAHEFLHALGFGHEQSRADRDDYVTINWDNIEEGHENNFEKLSKSQNGLLEFKYDYSSIMHYGTDYFSKNNKATIVPKQSGVSIGNRNGLSLQDAYEVIAVYGTKSVKTLLELLNNNGMPIVTTKLTTEPPTTTTIQNSTPRSTGTFRPTSAKSAKSTLFQILE